MPPLITVEHRMSRIYANGPAGKSYTHVPGFVDPKLVPFSCTSQA